MTLGSLFDGISGFPLAASWAGIETKWISEIDPYCLKVSKKNFPNAKQYGDIKQIGKGRTWEPEPVTIISGGFPCQPFSVAGKQQGKDDNRYLWPEMLRVIREVKPRWVIGENVPGIINLALDEVLTSLEDEGYKTETFNIPACSIGAPHKRNRVWIIANSIAAQREWKINRMEPFIISDSNKTLANSNSERPQGRTTEYRLWEETPNGQAQIFCSGQFWENFPTQSPVCGRDDGVSNRVVRLKSLGNAIVPQVAYEIFKAIKEIENNL